MSDLLQIWNLHPLLFCTILLFWAAPDLKNAPKIETKTYQLSNYYLLCENIYCSISVLFLIGVCGSSWGSGSQSSGRVGKFQAVSGGSRYFRIARNPEAFGIPRLVSGYKLQAWPPRASNLISGRLGKTRTRSDRKPAITRGPRRKGLCISFISILEW